MKVWKSSMGMQWGKGKSTYLLSRLCGEKAKGLLWSIGLYLNLPLRFTGAQTGFSGKLLKFYKITCSSLNNHFYWGSVLCFFVGFELTKAGVLLKIGFAYSKPFFVVLWRLKVFFPIFYFVWRQNWLELHVNIAFQQVIWMLFIIKIFTFWLSYNKKQNFKSAIL